MLVSILLLTQSSHCGKTWRTAFKDIIYKDGPVIYPSYMASIVPIAPIIPVPRQPLKLDPPPLAIASIPTSVSADAPAVEHYRTIPYSFPSHIG